MLCEKIEHLHTKNSTEVTVILCYSFIIYRLSETQNLKVMHDEVHLCKFYFHQILLNAAVQVRVQHYYVYFVHSSYKNCQNFIVLTVSINVHSSSKSII